MDEDLDPEESGVVPTDGEVDEDGDEVRRRPDDVRGRETGEVAVDDEADTVDEGPGPGKDEVSEGDKGVDQGEDEVDGGPQPPRRR